MNIYLDTIGCRLNQSEIETFARQFRAAGHTLVSSPEQADLVVINTCSVTAEAASDSRQKIRQAARAGAGEIVATGCWATLNPEAAASLPKISQVITNTDKDNLVPLLLHLPPESIDLEPIEREPVPGVRSRTRAFIKVQDGCDNRCTFCVTTIARGAGRSRAIEAVLADVRAARQGGTHEMVLTGVHLGSWGKDLSPSMHLKHLVQAILDETDTPRLRLSSLEPWDLDEDFFSLWQNSRLCPHLHLPLQSGSEATLRRMARKTHPESFAALVASARKVIPGVAITIDIITGFPGESDTEFSESLGFVRQMEFAGGHVFTYSARPGTAAARMPAQVPHELRKERNAQMRAALAESAATYQHSFLGSQVEVLWESLMPGSVAASGEHSWELGGWTGNYLKVRSLCPQPLWNTISTVRLEEVSQEGFQGIIQS